MSIRPGLLPWIFVAFLLAISLPSALSLVTLFPAYKDSALRDRAQKAITDFADSKGLLLSEISITHVDQKEVDILVREYRRGKDERSCFVINFTGGTTPCGTGY